VGERARRLAILNRRQEQVELSLFDDPDCIATAHREGPGDAHPFADGTKPR